MKNYVIRFADGSKPVFFDKSEAVTVADKYRFDASAIEFGEIELLDEDGSVQGWVMSDERAV